MYHFIGIYNIVSVIHHNTQQSVMDSQDYYTATQEQLLQELIYPGTNIFTIPITMLTTILHTSKQFFFLNHNIGTILEQIFILVYQYCDRQVQEILIFK